QLAYGMAQRISSTKEALAHFCPSKNAAIKHEMRIIESGHHYMRPAKYFNFVTRKWSPVVVYGLELTEIPFMRSLQHITERIIQALEMERRLQPDVDFEATFSALSDLEALEVISVSEFIDSYPNHLQY
ncbi:6395_t:CDS:2, partial [Acaulospora colombiana]